MDKKNYANLSVNPCRMCMPMGASLAFEGIERSMVIIHGSQGCSTYIRRHIAGHYNEPIDIASSSLTEEGTVYGGARNLKAGIYNLIQLYQPSVIGVISSCLAETIGDDVKRFVKEMKMDDPMLMVDLVPVQTPGYGGSQMEGYMAALKAMVVYYSEIEVENNLQVENAIQLANESHTANELHTVNEPHTANELHTVNVLHIAKELQLANKLQTDNEPINQDNLYIAIDSYSEKNTTKNNNFRKPLINIIVSSVTCEDLRELKRLLEQFEMDYILLPDISDALNSPFTATYNRLSPYGTKLEDIMKMKEADATLELNIFTDEQYSPGEYLKKAFGVPLYKLPLPIGLKYTDELVGTLCELTNSKCPDEINRERGRYLDAMIDSHKYNAMGRVGIYGEMDLVDSISQLCKENGVQLGVVVSSSSNAGFYEKMSQVVKGDESGGVLLADSDMDTFRTEVIKEKVNVIIGSSDGKMIWEKEGIDLIRIGFPIHDHMGGSRQRNILYSGSIALLDKITNTLLDQKHHGYREKMYKDYYDHKE